MSAGRKRLLFLHTGGTLGMVRAAPGPLAPGHYEETVLPYVRGLETIASIDGELVCNIDSSDMSPALWERLGGLVAAHIDAVDGIVVLHGTDTMAWTAAALALMLHGLSKPVVLTGSQRPISELRTDARSNLLHSAICATMDVPEVGLFFGSHLFRGIRATKSSVSAYDAFSSPNCPPLLTMGVDIAWGPVRPPPAGPLRFQPGFDPRVAVLGLFPGASSRQVDALVDNGARAVVLRGFGEGNLPQAGWPDAIGRATAAGVPVIVTSQCLAGAVRPGRYQNSAAARDAGACFAGDLTLEATVVKTMWLLARGCGPAALGDALLAPVAGECGPA